MTQQQLRIVFGTVLICILLSHTRLSAQIPTYNPYLLESDEYSNVAIFDVKVPGTYYFDLSWNTGKIRLKNGDSLIGYDMRFDLIKNHVELIWGNRRIGIYGTSMDSFEWYDSDREQRQLFVSRDQYKFSRPGNVCAFVEVLAEGQVQLLKSRSVIARYQGTSPSLIPDDYTASTNTIEDYFLVFGNEVHEVRGKRKTLALFDSVQLEEFIDANNLNISTEEDLIRIVKKYNEQI